MSATQAVLADVSAERDRQRAKWPNDGTTDQADGTGQHGDETARRAAQWATDDAMRQGEGVVTWRQILYEEVREAFCETDPTRLRAELVQVAAVCVKWIEAIDRRDAP